MLQSNLMNLILKRSLQKIVGPSLHARNRESSFSKLATLAENTPPGIVCHVHGKAIELSSE
jgi:hypothetical protein